MFLCVFLHGTSSLDLGVQAKVPFSVGCLFFLGPFVGLCWAFGLVAVCACAPRWAFAIVPCLHCIALLCARSCFVRRPCGFLTFQVPIAGIHVCLVISSEGALGLADRG